MNRDDIMLSDINETEGQTLYSTYVRSESSQMWWGGGKVLEIGHSDATGGHLAQPSMEESGSVAGSDVTPGLGTWGEGRRGVTACPSPDRFSQAGFVAARNREESGDAVCPSVSYLTSLSISLHFRNGASSCCLLTWV